MYKLNSLNYNIEDLKLLDSKTVILQRTIENEYLNNLNKLLTKNNYDFGYPMEELVNHLNIFPLDDRDDILFNLGGVLNHELYFNTISPYNKNIPIGKISNAINNKYVSFSNFKKVFIDKALKLIGSGYTFLVIDKNNSLNIINLSNEETPYSYGYIPLLGIDLWEHAYSLKYNHNRREYIENYFKMIDFDKVNNLYTKSISNI